VYYLCLLSDPLSKSFFPLKDIDTFERKGGKKSEKAYNNIRVNYLSERKRTIPLKQKSERGEERRKKEKKRVQVK
jgi:hypothetical protein